MGCFGGGFRGEATVVGEVGHCERMSVRIMGGGGGGGGAELQCPKGKTF